MAFYKKIKEDWFKADKVSNKNYTLTENNTENSYGWTWHDTPPTAYTEWLETQEIDERG